MNIKTTPASLAKLEKIFEEAKYVLRFEKGTFNSGYCILEHKRVVVINKFLNLEGRINSLLDILPTIRLDESMLTGESLKLYYQVVESKAQLLAEAEAAARGEAPAEAAPKAGGKRGKKPAATAVPDADAGTATPAADADTETPDTAETMPDTDTDAGETPEAEDHSSHQDSSDPQ